MPRSCSPTSWWCPTRSARTVRFEEGEGPRLDPVDDGRGVAPAFATEIDLQRLAPVLETVGAGRARRCRRRRRCSASAARPGRWRPTWSPARARRTRRRRGRSPIAIRTLFGALIDRLVEASIDYLVGAARGRRRCGADLRQLGRRPADDAEFDALGDRADRGDRRRREGEVPGRADHRLSARRRRAACSATSPGPGSTASGSTGRADGAYGRARGADRRWRCRAISIRCVLVAGGEALDRAVDARSWRPWRRAAASSISATASLPETPIAHVERLVERVRASTGPA